ncbi:hypothetical protein [Paenirhodobacter sp. CAU 1674]|uniref:hypothetical protein n=1 Tax=Paenirhodobacter sp. CAU 1674 TaxID=3032596 RepID=UPI0023DA42DD|nr:hypothetical protein [Paenirhodobacter sp. CAU 1674]MDF2142927.1 hypothetical protein [Paenirhodobacter sp. CAU 1674]
MQITRRTFSLSTLAALAVPRAALVANDYAPELILANLERAIWLSTNRGAPRAAYVVAAPWCPYCHQLYDTIVALKPDVDFRFVFMGQKIAGGAMVNAYFSDALDQVGQVFADPRARNPLLSPRAGELMDFVNLVTGHLMAGAMGRLGTGSGGSGAVGGFAYPLVVQREVDGRITGTLGAWLELSALAARTAPGTAAGPDPARYAAYLREAPHYRPGSQNHFGKTEKTPYFAAPVPDAPEVEWIGQGSGYKVAGTLSFGGEDWIAVRAFTRTDAMQWGRKRDFFTQ